MLSRLAIVCVGMIVCAGAGRVSAQAVIPEADRYIKLGTRIPEVAPGEGGDLQSSLRSRSGVVTPATCSKFVLSPTPGSCPWSDSQPVLATANGSLRECPSADMKH